MTTQSANSGTCLEADCQDQVAARGYCVRHYGLRLKDGRLQRLPNPRDVWEAKVQAAIPKISEHLVLPWTEAEFAPIFRYRGHYASPGRVKALYNYFCAAMELMIPSVSSMSVRSQGHWGLGQSDLSHITGLHAQYGTQPTSFNALGARLLANPDVTKRTPHLLDYLIYLREEGGLREVTSHGRELALLSKYIPKQAQPKIPRYWPYLSKQTPADTKGLDLLIAIEAVVPHSIPQQVREDICQDLVVAVLSGRAALDRLQEAFPVVLKKSFKDFPLRYGPLSLEAPPPWDSEGRTLGEVITEGEHHHRFDTIGMCSTCEQHSEDLQDGLCPRCYEAMEKNILNRSMAARQTDRLFPGHLHRRNAVDRSTLAEGYSAAEWMAGFAEPIGSSEEGTTRVRGRVSHKRTDESLVGPTKAKVHKAPGGGKKSIGVDYTYKGNAPTDLRDRRGDEWLGVPKDEKG